MDNMTKNRSPIAKLLILAMVMAFLVIPTVYAAENAPKFPVYRDIATVVTPYNGVPVYRDIRNIHWTEANAVYTYFEDYLNTYKIDFLQDKLATFRNIYTELGKHPLYFHLATEGDTGPALKAYDEYFAPEQLFRNVYLGELSTTKLVFLSACYSLQNYDKGDYTKNFGFVFVNIAKAKYVIGSRGKIDTIAAALFAMEFYDYYLVRGYGIHSAFANAYADTKEKLKELISLGTELIFGPVYNILVKNLIKVVYEFLAELAKGIVTSYLQGGLVDAWSSLPNLDIYDGSYSSSGGGGGGGSPPVIM